MNDPTPPRRKLSWLRAGFALWLGAYVAWYFIAPAVARAMHAPDEAAWVQLFLLFSTLIPGILIGAVGILAPGRLVGILAAIATVAHVAVGLGFHPT